MFKSIYSVIVAVAVLSSMGIANAEISQKENYLVLLVGKSCDDWYDFYVSELPGYMVACTGYDTLKESKAVYQILTEYDWNVMYVIDDHDEMPVFTNTDGITQSPSGVSIPSENWGISWRYVYVVEHELAHLECECGHGVIHDWYIQIIHTRNVHVD